jgi:hypothetical protein
MLIILDPLWVDFNPKRVVSLTDTFGTPRIFQDVGIVQNRAKAQKLAMFKGMLFLATNEWERRR